MYRMTCLRFVLAVAAAAGLSWVSAARGDEGAKVTPEQEQYFEQRVRPILVDRCLNCHGPETQESGLRLDSRQAILQGGDSGNPAAVPGDVRESQLIAAIRHEGDLQMPASGKLPDEEIAALVAWVEMGLPWPNYDRIAVSQDDRFAVARQRHWAFQPIESPPLPEVQQQEWPSMPLDYFVLHELEQAGLTPSPEADRRTLIRRVTFDLIGLPPTPGEVEAFVQDEREDAYERLVDRLLNSPHYGERWGRHWLDVARYADTKGYAFGRERRYPYAYTYRDYVIRALNEDLPYDRFILEQLAADYLAEGEQDPSLAALGLLTVGRKFNNVHDDIDDQIDVVSRGLMGLTVACARCHDHKYDPIPTEDYYSLYGVFASSHEPEILPLIGEPEDTPEYREFQVKLEELRANRDKYGDERHTELLELARTHVAQYLVRAAFQLSDEALQKIEVSLGPDDLKPPLVERWRRYVRDQVQAGHPVWSPLHEVIELGESATPEQLAGLQAKWTGQQAGLQPGQLNPLVRTALTSAPVSSGVEVVRIYGKLLEETYAAWKQAGGNESATAAMSDEQRQLLEVLLSADSPTNIPRGELMRYLNRAEADRYRELERQIESHQVNSPGAPPRAMVVADKPTPVEPQVFIRGNQGRRGDHVPRRFPRILAGPEATPFQQGSGRLEMAQAIVDPANPLTRRVIVNRVWLHHFGLPLVDTPSDFGVRCEPPRQQQLLDHLATRFLELGWSLKKLHREIVLSSTYRQQSLERPECLEVDPENRLLWRMNRRRLEFEPLRDALLAVAGNLDTKLGGRPVDITSQPYNTRRTVYAFIDRQDLPNLLRVFDFASPDQSSASRPRTTVPQQALFLMNSPFVIQQAKLLVTREEIAACSDSAEKIQAIYRRVFSRPASEAEVAAGRAFIEAAETQTSEVAELSAWEQYAQALLLSNEFTFID